MLHRNIQFIKTSQRQFLDASVHLCSNSGWFFIGDRIMSSGIYIRTEETLKKMSDVQKGKHLIELRNNWVNYSKIYFLLNINTLEMGNLL